MQGRYRGDTGEIQGDTLELLGRCASASPRGSPLTLSLTLILTRLEHREEGDALLRALLGRAQSQMHRLHAVEMVRSRLG